MKLNIYLLLSLAILFAGGKINAGDKNNIIPLPKKAEYTGSVFMLDKNTEITTNGQIKDFPFLRSYLMNQIQNRTGIYIAETPDKKNKKTILFKTDRSIKHPEGYNLVISNN